MTHFDISGPDKCNWSSFIWNWKRQALWLFYSYSSKCSSHHLLEKFGNRTRLILRELGTTTYFLWKIKINNLDQNLIVRLQFLLKMLPDKMVPVLYWNTIHTDFQSPCTFFISGSHNGALLFILQFYFWTKYSQFLIENL